MLYSIFLKLISKYLSWILVAIFIMYIYIDKRSSLNEIKGLWDTIGNLRFKLVATKDFTSKSSLQVTNSKKVEEQLKSKLSFASDSINTEWKKKMSVLMATVKAKNEKLKGNILVEAYWETKFDSVVNVLQSKVGDRDKITFYRKFSTVIINGFTLTNPPFAYLTVKREPIVLNVTVTATEDKLHNVYVVSSDSDLIFRDVKSSFVGFTTKSTFWDKMKKAPRLKLGFSGDDTFIKTGLRIWKLEPEFKLGNRGIAGGVSINILN